MFSENSVLTWQLMTCSLTGH